MTRSLLWGYLLTLLAHCGHPIQFSPLDDVLGGSECALMVGGDRSTLYDYGTNLLRGTLDFGGGSTCITYDAVNQAYIEARKRIHITVPPVEREWKTDEIAKVGELLLDISSQLTRTYGLSMEEVENGLPQIDTSKTLIQEVCPPYLSNVECHPGKYRRLDGLCNNVDNPSWGATMTPFTRLVQPQFADGLNAPRQSILGQPLPLPRVVSRTMHPDEGYHDHAGTVMIVAWGQFMDHDFTLTATPLDPRNKNDPEECCNRPPHLKHPYCLEIVIPDDDYFYKGFKVKCIDFVRSFPSVRPGCRLGSKTPYNTLTGVIDGNTVYGVNEEFGRHLRSGFGGELRMNPVFSEYGLKDLLPLKLDVPDEGCTRTNSSQFCFEAGEIRVNEQLVLTCMHTLMAREHNRVARGLAAVNPHWDDETLYQEARRIVVAEIQHITFNEFLPIVLGKDVMTKFGLMLQKEGYWDGYDPTVNPNIIAAFSAAAFRFGHSLLPTAVERWSKAHKFISSKRLSDLIRRPYDLYRAGVMDEYLMGLMNQVAQAMDDSITQEVTNHLLKKPGNRFGLDLVAFNMQRGREFGIPGYMQYRKFCGLPTADSFEELFGSMPNSTIYRYSSIFAHPNDIDLWSGGVSERPLPSSMLGPTFACIIATQLSFARRGDRFWYELPNQPSSFTPEQLQEIRKVKLSRIMCDNTDLLDTVQIYPMVLPDHEINPRVPCKSGVIPSLDLSKWAEFPNPSQYVTKKITFPAQAPHNVVVICNVTSDGCSVPPITVKPQTTSPQLQGNAIDEFEGKETGTGNLLQGDKLINTLSIITTSPVLFIQRLRKRFEDGSNNRTKRQKRDAQLDRGKTRFTYSHQSEIYSDGTPKNEKSRPTHLSTKKRKSETSQEPNFYPEIRQKKKNKSKQMSRDYMKKQKNITLHSIDDYDELKNRTTNPKNLAGNISSKNSRSDKFNRGESNVDYIQTTRDDRGDSGHYSLFKNPVYDSNDDSDEEVILGGSLRQHDGTTPFPIVDADHDYDSEFEYVQMDDLGSGKEKESDNSNYEEANEESHQMSEEAEEENEEDEGKYEEVPKEDENDGSEEIVKYPPVVVVYKGDSKDVYQTSHIDPSLDIHERYITKDPLAGPGATRGFNHDFQILRGVPIQGGVVVQPNTRFPTVPGFNTSQIHNIIKIGRLPGVTGVGPNFTKVGIIPIEPARHARPNDLGDYVGLRGLYGSSDPPRRPVMTKRPHYYGRRPLHNGYPVKSQRVVLRRPGRYRQPIRLSSQLTYPVRSQYRTHSYRPSNNGPQHLLRIKIIEDRSSNGDPEEKVNNSEEKNHEELPGGNEYEKEWDYNHDEYEHDDTKSEEDEDQNREDLTNKPYNNSKNSRGTSRYKEEKDINTSVHKNEEMNTDMEHLVQKPTRIVEDKTDDKRTYRIKTPKIRRPKRPSQPRVIPSYKKQIASVSDDYDSEEEWSEEENEKLPNQNNQDDNQSYEAQSVGDSSEKLQNHEEEQSHESQSEEEKEELENTSTMREKSTEEGAHETENNDRSSEEKEDISSTLSKLIKRTEDLENDKITPNGEEPISYNNFWTLEYSLPNFR